MTQPSFFQQSLIIDFFREFYEILLLQKAKALTGLSFQEDRDESALLTSLDLARNLQNSSSKKMAPPPSSGQKNMTESIQSAFESLLDIQMNSALKQGGDFFATYYKDAQYLMVALADETFLNLDWPERRIWESNLFESRMYSSHIAGQAVFDALDDYLRNRDPSTKDLGAIYLWGLGLGFQGKYRGDKDQTPLLTYKRQLYKFITGCDPNLLEKNNLFFPDSYLYTVQDNLLVTLPCPQVYHRIFWGSVLFFFVASFFVWYQETSSLRRVLDQIITIKNQGA